MILQVKQVYIINVYKYINKHYKKGELFLKLIKMCHIYMDYCKNRREKIDILDDVI